MKAGTSFKLLDMAIETKRPESLTLFDEIHRSALSGMSPTTAEFFALPRENKKTFVTFSRNMRRKYVDRVLELLEGNGVDIDAYRKEGSPPKHGRMERALLDEAAKVATQETCEHFDEELSLGNINREVHHVAMQYFVMFRASVNAALTYTDEEIAAFKKARAN